MLIQENALFRFQNVNVPEAYAALNTETNLPSCTAIPSPCLLFEKANEFIGATYYPFIRAVLERVEVPRDDLSLRNIFLIQNSNSTLDDEIVYRAFVKRNGHAARIFSSETWEEWTEYKTPLGRVVANFLEYAVQLDAQKAKLAHRSRPWMKIANKEAQQLIADLQRPLMEKIEILRSVHCYEKAKNAELKGCETPEIGALITKSLSRDFQATLTRFKIKKDCCIIKMVQSNRETVASKRLNEIDTGTPCTGDTHLITAIAFKRYDGAIPTYCKI